MMKPTLLKAVIILFYSGISFLVNGQNISAKYDQEQVLPSEKPYKILTNGKKITVQSKQNLKSLIVWTAGGHRIVEQKKINAPSYSFTITINEKIFFLLIEMEDGKRYTSKIGVQ